MNKKELAAKAVELLKKEYPDAICSLEYEKPHELLFATRLAAQCTDARVNMVTPVLYSKYPTLEALAENLAGFEGLICPVMNARRSQVYTALFRSDGKTLTRLMPDSALAISELDEKLAEYGERVMLCGDGYGITKAGFEKTPTADTPDRLTHQSGYSVASVALREYLAGNATDDMGAKVTYLRPSQAERELMDKQSQKGEK